MTFEKITKNSRAKFFDEDKSDQEIPPCIVVILSVLEGDRLPRMWGKRVDDISVKVFRRRSRAPFSPAIFVDLSRSPPCHCRGQPSCQI